LRRLNPTATRVGMVWNAGEVNSEIGTKIGRAACKRLGIELIEANAENSAALREATNTVLARDLDVFWVGPDVNVLSAVEVVLGLCREAKVPVFTSIPGTAAEGSLFDLGANYTEVGRRGGQIAGDVLRGVEIKTMPIERFVPPTLQINEDALKGVAGGWKLPKDWLESADVWIKDGKRRDRPKPTPEPSATAKPKSAAE
ncbi:MAG: ABC transporter substrate binding protein, partial [Planctomycetia bacterium]